MQPWPRRRDASRRRCRPATRSSSRSWACSRATSCRTTRARPTTTTVTGAKTVDERHLLPPDPAVPQGLPRGREPGRRPAGRTSAAAAGATTRRRSPSSSGASCRARSTSCATATKVGRREVPAGRRVPRADAGPADASARRGWPAQIMARVAQAEPTMMKDIAGHSGGRGRVDGGRRAAAAGARPEGRAAGRAAGAREPAARGGSLPRRARAHGPAAAAAEAAAAAGGRRAADELADLFQLEAGQAAQPVRDVPAAASSSRPTTRSTRCWSG
ncbi:MAG: hypothetical protein MZU95_01260 [Desulfomicrobium escambiense]|nr:hypothetical protein [Desulfomicrobium escambiense]